MLDVGFELFALLPRLLQVHGQLQKADIGGIGQACTVLGSRTFQTCLRTTPTEYLRTVRLQSACKLLMETDTPVTEIAQACGLGSSSYFGRLLRQEIGLSPSAYRAKWQKTTP